MPYPQVRLATSRDVNTLIDLVREAHIEEGSPLLTFDAQSVFSVIIQAMSGEALIGVIGEPGNIQSACFMRVSRPWFSAAPVIDTMLVYSRPEYRKTDNTKKLLLWIKEKADRLECPLQLDIPSAEHNKPKLSLCQRIFSSPCGLTFTYSPHADAPTEPPSPIVEPARLNDADQIQAIANKIAAEAAHFAPEDDLSRPVIQDALQGNGVIGVVRNSNEIEATIFLQVYRPWFSSSECLLEHWAFVRPEYRKSKNAKALLLFAKRQADRLNIPMLIGVAAKHDFDRKLLLYRRLFGEPTNVHHLYNPATVI